TVSGPSSPPRDRARCPTRRKLRGSSRLHIQWEDVNPTRRLNGDTKTFRVRFRQDTFFVGASQLYWDGAHDISPRVDSSGRANGTADAQSAHPAPSPLVVSNRTGLGITVQARSVELPYQ